MECLQAKDFKIIENNISIFLSQFFITKMSNMPIPQLLPLRPFHHPTSVGEENETLFIRVWKLLPSRRVLKTLKGSSKGKAQRGQYRLVVGLSCYKVGFFYVYATDETRDNTTHTQHRVTCSNKTVCMNQIKRGKQEYVHWVE